MRLNDLRSLLVHQLKDTMYVKLRLTRALPEMIESAHAPRLRDALQRHLEASGQHLGRLSILLRDLDGNAIPERSSAMEGMISEASQVLGQTREVEPAVLDAAIIATAQRMQHYSIAAYGCSRAFARTLGEEAVANALDEMLQSEREADRELTEVAESDVNPRAGSDKS